MRITGGQWRGRALLMPKSDAVRPTQDRVREALFGLLQPVLPGAAFLDLFAGSGAVGLEALSRGAREATFLERDRTVFATLLRNLAAFGVDARLAHNTDTLRMLGGLEARVLGDAEVPGTPPPAEAGWQRFPKDAGGQRSPQRSETAPPPRRGFLPPALRPADIVFADPPYLWAREHGFGALAQALMARGLLASGGFFVAEFDHRTDPEEIPGLTLLRDRAYGKTRLAIWRHDTP